MDSSTDCVCRLPSKPLKSENSDFLRLKFSITGADSEAGLEEQETPRQTDQERGATVPSGAHVCLVPEEVSPLGGALGGHSFML
jgi:hypothetical protein